MANNGLGLTAGLLAKVFPFHFAISRDGAVLQSGAVLRRLAPSLLDGALAAETLLIREPNIPFSFEAIRERTASAFTIEILLSGLRMRGEIIEPPDTEALLFLGSPWLTEVAELEKYGLRFSDFALHDSVADYLPILHAQSAFLSDNRAMTQMLTGQAVKLREANRKLEAHHAATQALAESRSLTEAGPKILKALCVALKWDLGVLWLGEERAAGLQCKAVSRRDARDDEAFTQALIQHLRAPGDPLADAVCDTCRPMWIENIAPERGFARPYSDAGLPRRLRISDPAFGKGFRRDRIVQFARASAGGRYDRDPGRYRRPAWQLRACHEIGRRPAAKQRAVPPLVRGRARGPLPRGARRARAHGKSGADSHVGVHVFHRGVGGEFPR
jgi:hypothetical protein